MLPCQLSASIMYPGTSTTPTPGGIGRGRTVSYTWTVHFSVDEYPSDLPVPERLAYVQGCLPYDSSVYFQGLPPSDPVCDGEADAPPNLLELRVGSQFSHGQVRDNQFYLTLDSWKDPSYFGSTTFAPGSPLHYLDYRISYPGFDLTEKLRIISN